jgi:hypothetical protein
VVICENLRPIKFIPASLENTILIHSRVPRPQAGHGKFRGNDENGIKRTFYEAIIYFIFGLFSSVFSVISVANN